MTGINIDRLHKYQANPEYRRERTIESLGMVYKCHYPTMTPQTARGVKTSAIHDRLVAARAYFRDVSGWEGADWYAPPGVTPEVELSWRGGSVAVSSGVIRFARAFPSSTPHWSNELTSHTHP